MSVAIAFLLSLGAVQSAEDLRAQEAAIRTRMADRDGDQCYGQDRVMCAIELAGVLEKQGRASEGIDAILESLSGPDIGSGRAAGGVRRYAMDAIAAIRERSQGISDESVAARWRIAVDARRRPSTMPADRASEDPAEPRFVSPEPSYIDKTAAALLTLGRVDEARILAEASYRDATAFRDYAGRGEQQRADIARFRLQRGRTLFFVRATYAATRQNAVATDAEWNAAERLLSAGAFDAAEQAYRTLLARAGKPLIATPTEIRATRGLALAVAGQGRDRVAEAIALQRRMLQRLFDQSWGGDRETAQLAEELARSYRIAGAEDRGELVRRALAAFRAGADPRRF